MSTTIKHRSRQFSDLNLLLTRHPMTGDVAKVVDENAVKKAVLQLVMMKPHDVPFHPEISCQANALLFELATPMTAELIKKTIIDVITKFEPRVQLVSVTVNDQMDKNAYGIEIIYVIVGTDKPVTVSTLLYRTR